MSVAVARRILRIALILWAVSWCALMVEWIGAAVGWWSAWRWTGSAQPSVLGVAWQTLETQKWVALACGFAVIFMVKPPLPREDEDFSSSSLSTAPSPVAMRMTLWALAGMLSALLLVHGVVESPKAMDSQWRAFAALMLACAQGVCLLVLGWSVWRRSR